jgi:hypothetical protein
MERKYTTHTSGEPEEAPETPPTEPQPSPVQDPPAEPDPTPYVVRGGRVESARGDVNNGGM